MSTENFLELTDPAIQLKPIGQADLPVLLAIYSSTREKELEAVPHWSIDTKRAFLLQQFNAQHTYYHSNYNSADYWLLRKDDQCIGRLYVDWNNEGSSVRIIDIAILPAWQNKGIGSGILRDLMKKAAVLDLPLSIHVESFNPAKKLYLRLGFEMISETNGVYHLMEWKNTI
jgi:GNAT superfamily N-acetyltransferase